MSQQEIVVPDGTTIHETHAKEVSVVAARWDIFGRPDRFITTVEFVGHVNIDVTKPVYILQFEEDEESKP